MYDDILLPTDGSDGIDAAATHAATLADRFGATVHVLSVVDTRNRFESPTSGLSTEAWTQAERERADHAIERTVAALPDDLPVETTVVEGGPAARNPRIRRRGGDGPRGDGDPRPDRA